MTDDKPTKKEMINEQMKTLAKQYFKRHTQDIILEKPLVYSASNLKVFSKNLFNSLKNGEWKDSDGNIPKKVSAVVVIIPTPDSKMGKEKMVKALEVFEFD